MLTLIWLIFPCSFFSTEFVWKSDLHLAKYSSRLRDENEQTWAHCVFPDRLLASCMLARETPETPLCDQYPFRGARVLHPNHRPPTPQLLLLCKSPAFYFAVLLKAAQSGTTQKTPFLRRENICLYIIYLFTHWGMFPLLRHTRYVPTFSLQHVLQICSPPPLFPRFTLSVSCLREMLLTVNWKR